MGKFEEYLKLGWKGLHNLPNIAKGFYNAFLDDLEILPEAQKEEAKKRIETCSGCKYLSYTAKENGLYNTAREDPHCSLCGCMTRKKAFSFGEDCPLGDMVVKDFKPYMLGGNPVWGVSGATEKMYKELVKDSPLGTLLEINGEKYLYLNIEKKFTKKTFE